MAANAADRSSFGDAPGLSRRQPEYDSGIDRRTQVGARAATAALALDAETPFPVPGVPGFAADQAGRLEGWLPANLRHTLYVGAKRGFDLAVASILLLVLLPAWLLIATLIATTSPGPVLFKQRRTGQDGHVFTCLKFRTMVTDAEARLHADPALAAAFGENWKLERDPRVTGIGRVLRKTSLDELPQLINILRGEMSVVGPRPVQLLELEQEYGHWGPVVFSAKPGVTGLWQVSGRSTVTYAERIALDLEYVHRRTFWLDLKIVLLTIPAALLGRGAV
jgi:exopolysaccharide production protein ExoY